MFGGVPSFMMVRVGDGGDIWFPVIFCLNKEIRVLHYGIPMMYFALQCMLAIWLVTN